MGLPKQQPGGGCYVSSDIFSVCGATAPGVINAPNSRKDCFFVLFSLTNSIANYNGLLL